MAPQFPHKAQQEENRWLSPLLPSILAAMSLIVTVDLASLAVAAECQLTEKEGEMVQGMTAWKGDYFKYSVTHQHHNARYLWWWICTVSSARECAK